MKSLSSATTTSTILPDGRLELTIEHSLIRGVTPAMLVWWFNHIDEPMSYEGKTYHRYLVWHPRDHLHYAVVQRSPDGSAGRGARVRIVESFNRNPAHMVDSVEVVERLAFEAREDKRIDLGSRARSGVARLTLD